MPSVITGSAAPAVRIPSPPDLHWFRASGEQDPDVLALLVLGSVARGDHHGRSDLDLVVLARSGSVGALTRRFQSAASARFPRQLVFSEQSKVALYSADASRKVDAFIIEDLAAIARYVAGSRLACPEDAVVLDKTGEVTVWLGAVAGEIDDLDVVVPAQIARFAYHFEQASACHALSDMYRARFNLEIALHCVAYLEWRAAGRAAFAWLPRRLLQSVSREVADALRGYNAPMDPSRFHPAKVHVLEMFRAALGRLNRGDQAAIELCELALERDRFWNHRDAAVYTSDELARGVLYRASSPHRYAADSDYRSWVARREITTRIDLRGHQEKLDHPIDGVFERTFEAPVDPWRDLAADDPLNEGAEPHETGYRFTALRCGHALRAVVEAVADDRGAVLVHCQAGVDRTGVIIALAHLLAGEPRGSVLSGYSASSGAKPIAILARVLDLVDGAGGVRALAERSGLEARQIEAFQRRMRA